MTRVGEIITKEFMERLLRGETLPPKPRDWALVVDIETGQLAPGSPEPRDSEAEQREKLAKRRSSE